MNKYFRRLSKLHKLSDSAVDVFIQTEKKLADHNSSLDALVDELEIEMSSVTDAWQKAKARKAMNEGIRKRIAEIIESH